ncbi:hypothetical protein [Pararhizobium sp.]|uniref:hypothetical protein n=1 Tax=Pararhizobium sp. TaxID=1977563 RepID=UPI00271FDE7E|nr:hypothetical protein [Pararhizobium sp.]MDO9417115.1 hypothetical protein [Pararhizobium sp.]
MPYVRKRVVVHFPGFEPLDALAHRSRYERSADQSAAAWDHAIVTGPLEGDRQSPSFLVEATGPDWHTKTRVHILDHNDLIAGLHSKPLIQRILDGYISAAHVIVQGGLQGYFRHAWRFGLFFLFPFLLVAIGLELAVTLAGLPVFFGLSALLLILTIPAGLLFFIRIFLPAAERLYTLHLFSDWELALSLARLDNADANRRLDVCLAAFRVALSEPADEYVITSHSMGSSMAVHVTGMLLSDEPEFFAGKTVVFATLGSGLLQCALLGSARILRQRTGLIARCKEIFWMDVQCLTDSIHFYKSKPVSAAGHADAPQATVTRIRFKYMLTPQRYRRIRRDFLRVHRQYVLGSDRRSAFDFSLMTSGPLPARDFAGFSQENLPPFQADGAIGSPASA